MYCEAGIGIRAFVTFYICYIVALAWGHAGCAEFSCSHSAEFSFFRGASGQKSQVQVLERELRLGVREIFTRGATLS